MSSLVRIEEDILDLEQTIRQLRTSASGCSSDSANTAYESQRAKPELSCIPESDSEDEDTGSRL